MSSQAVGAGTGAYCPDYPSSFSFAPEYSWSYHICYTCDGSFQRRAMEEHDGNLYCKMCAELPPYSDKLYRAIVSFQKIFRKHFTVNAKECPCCHKFVLKTEEFRNDMGPICLDCVKNEIDEMRQEYDDEVYYDDSTRCYCDEKWCRGECTGLRCGCIDVCRNRCGTKEE